MADEKKTENKVKDEKAESKAKEEKSESRVKDEKSENKPKEDNAKSNDEKKEDITKMDETSKQDKSEEISAKEEKKPERKITTLLIAVLIILIVFLMINVFMSASLANNLGLVKDLKKQPNVNIVTLTDSACTDCYDSKDAVDIVKSSSLVRVLDETSIDINSSEGKEYVSKYNVTRIPAVVVLGDVNKVDIDNFTHADNALVYNSIQAPFFDVASGQVKGRVSVKIIRDSTCKHCFDLGFLQSGLKNAGISLSNFTLMDYSGSEAKQIVKEYNIDAIPTIIVSSDIEYYDGYENFFSDLATKESDGNLVVRVKNPPYINVSTGDMVGAVSLIYVSDATCTKCYNVTLHKEILADPQSLGMYIEKEEYADISSSRGKALVQQYNITTIPTVIVSTEAQYYPGFEKGWLNIGTKENDGKYVFRRNQIFTDLAYKDLVTGELKGNVTDNSITVS